MSDIKVTASTLELIKLAIAEDLDCGQDITSVATVDSEDLSTAHFVARKSGVIAGLHIAQATLEFVGISSIELLVSDGDHVQAGTEIIRAHGSTRAILLAERTALNFLGHLSGIATLTRIWVDAVAGHDTKIRDTRKTTPGFRELEKYAVRMGGGTNHRMSLSQSALIKDNHIEAAGGVSKAFEKVRKLFPDVDVEIEVDTLDQLQRQPSFESE